MIRIVIDSGSQITPNLRRQLNAEVVALTVVVDGVALREGLNIDLAGITAALERGATVSTSTPSPGDFLRAYQRCADDGATAILSIHTGGALSSTANTARVAAGAAPIPVEVVDTGTASFPVALCAWAASDALDAGSALGEAAGVALATAASIDSVFTVGTLALAERGGRIADTGEESGIPVIAFTDGFMRVIAHVEDAQQATEAMVSYVVERDSAQQIRVGVGHLAATELADQLDEQLRERVSVEQLVRYDVGPSIAAHTGLGTVGCVFHPTRPRVVPPLPGG